jgi:hypothetical protein
MVQVQATGTNALLSRIGSWDSLDAPERTDRMRVLRSLWVSMASITDERVRSGPTVERYTELPSMIVYGLGAP